jgi:hypothetical protein
MSRIHRSLTAAVLALVVAVGSAAARRRQPEPTPRNPPVPRVREHFIRHQRPRYRIHFVPPVVPKVRTHLLSKPRVPEVHTRWLVPPTQPAPIYEELAPSGSRTEALFKIVRNPHYRDGLRAAREPKRDRADVELHKLTRMANQGQAPRIKLQRGEEGRLREAVKKKVYEEMNVTRFSPPGDIKRADALVPARYKKALRTGEALELLYPDRRR